MRQRLAVLSPQGLETLNQLQHQQDLPKPTVPVAMELLDLPRSLAMEVEPLLGPNLGPLLGPNLGPSPVLLISQVGWLAQAQAQVLVLQQNLLLVAEQLGMMGLEELEELVRTLGPG
jgi:hypothetical protein